MDSFLLKTKIRSRIESRMKIRDQVVHYHLVRMFIEHERYPKFFNNMMRELSQASRFLKASNIDKIINNCTDMFMEAVLKYEEQRALSVIEKQRLLDEAGSLDAIADEVEIERKIVEESEKVISYPGGVARHEAN